MKRCPECRRDYFDDSLSYCLDDGTPLLEGPASGSTDEPATAMMPSAGSALGSGPSVSGSQPGAAPRTSIAANTFKTASTTRISKPPNANIRNSNSTARQTAPNQ